MISSFVTSQSVDITSQDWKQNLVISCLSTLLLLCATVAKCQVLLATCSGGGSERATERRDIARCAGCVFKGKQYRGWARARARPAGAAFSYNRIFMAAASAVGERERERERERTDRELDGEGPLEIRFPPGPRDFPRPFSWWVLEKETS